MTEQPNSNNAERWLYDKFEHEWNLVLNDKEKTLLSSHFPTLTYLNSLIVQRFKTKESKIDVRLSVNYSDYSGEAYTKLIIAYKTEDIQNSLRKVVDVMKNYMAILEIVLEQTEKESDSIDKQVRALL